MGAAAGNRHDLDAAAVGVHDLAADRQPKAGAAGAGLGQRTLYEGIEDAFLLGWIVAWVLVTSATMWLVYHLDHRGQNS